MEVTNGLLVAAAGVSGTLLGTIISHWAASWRDERAREHGARAKVAEFRGKTLFELQDASGELLSASMEEHEIKRVQARDKYEAAANRSLKARFAVEKLRVRIVDEQLRGHIRHLQVATCILATGDLTNYRVPKDMRSLTDSLDLFHKRISELFEELYGEPDA